MRFSKTLQGILFGTAVIALSCNTIATKENFGEPADPDKFNPALWETVDHGLSGGFGSVDIRYGRSTPPQSAIDDTIVLTGWKGEKINAQLVYWSRDDVGSILVEPGDLIGNIGVIQSDFISAGVIRYTLTDEFLNGCGYRDKDTLPVHLVADMIDSTNLAILSESQSRPVWLSISIPPFAEPGDYYGSVWCYSGLDSIISTIHLRVQDMVLPSPASWIFHLDLWQNPYAVARYHNVKEWSQEHMDLMKEVLNLLAGAGQKCITTTLNEKPWGGQTYDPFGGMITWIRNSDNSWNYDYSIFDQYVSLAMECGITGQINCYSMVPWGNRLQWYDEDSTRFITEVVLPGSERYREIWKPFLIDFKVHLMEAGWLDICYLALDERGESEMQSMFAFLEEVAPEFKIAMAGQYFSGVTEKIDDFSYGWGVIDEITRDITGKRTNNGQLTTYYVCCSDSEPNNFTFSPPAESCYQGWFAAAMGFDGFLRWAFNSWVEDPVQDSRFRTWPAGDTYFIYPGARSSIRFERLIEGIQDYEKIRILKEKLAMDPSLEAAEYETMINQFLSSFDSKTLKSRSASELTREGKKMVDNISVYITR